MHTLYKAIHFKNKKKHHNYAHNTSYLLAL